MTKPVAFPGERLVTDADIESFVGTLFDSAIKRDLYGLALTPDHRVVNTVFCIEGYPNSPKQWYRTARHGWKQAGLTVFEAWRTACAELGGSEFLIVWERPGGRELTPADMTWAQTMLSLGQRPGPALRAQVLLHSGGARLIDPADLEELASK